MNKLPRYFILFFLTIFLLQMFVLLLLVANPGPAAAAIDYTPNVTLGDFKKGVSFTIDGNTIGNYVLTIYKLAVNVVGILATVVMMFGGLLWITAGGNAGKVDNAKSWIAAAATGLVLTLASYTLLNTINPDLVRFNSIDPEKPDTILWCCEPSGQDDAAYNTTYKECDGSFNVGKIARSGECVDAKDCNDNSTVGDYCATVRMPSGTCQYENQALAAEEQCLYLENNKCSCVKCICK